jgi:hypothetical protein
MIVNGSPAGTSRDKGWNLKFRAVSRTVPEGRVAAVGRGEGRRVAAGALEMAALASGLAAEEADGGREAVVTVPLPLPVQAARTRTRPMRMLGPPP